MKKIFFVLLFLLLVIPVLAVPDYQDLYVNDFANVFTQNQTTELRSVLSNLESETTAEVNVLTVETVAPMSTSQYAQEVFEKWEIGKADKDNGLLILYAKEEDKIWVSTGYGLEGILPDSKIGRILDQTFVPVRSNNMSAHGVILATYAFVNVIENNKEEVLSGQTTPSNDASQYIILFYIILFGIPLLINYNKRHPKCLYCKGRSNISKIKKITKTKKTIIGEIKTYEYIVTFKCKKCNKTFTKKMKNHPKTTGGFVFLGGGGRGGGFSGGGSFGGGSFGGGGAGR